MFLLFTCCQRSPQLIVFNCTLQCNPRFSYLVTCLSSLCPQTCNFTLSNWAVATTLGHTSDTSLAACYNDVERHQSTCSKAKSSVSLDKRDSAALNSYWLWCTTYVPKRKSGRNSGINHQHPRQKIKFMSLCSQASSLIWPAPPNDLSTLCCSNLPVLRFETTLPATPLSQRKVCLSLLGV